MQFTSNIIVALLLAVSASTVTAAQKSANLRGGGSNLQEEKAFSDPLSSGLSNIMNNAENPPFPNLERSLADSQSGGCPGLNEPRQQCYDLECPYVQKCYSPSKDECYCL